LATDKSAPAASEPLYPALEGFIESATEDDIRGLYTSLREGLAELKGPRAELGKKAAAAIQRTEELLFFLLQIREKIEENKRGGPR
jgi:hypothetical protein